MDIQSESKTVMRVRIAHVHTLKDGWRLGETTVEATGTDISYDDIQTELRLAYSYGVDESVRRNKLEKDYNRGVAPTPLTEGQR
jgi:hypothetical protein